jgi:hypothetical protein
MRNVIFHKIHTCIVFVYNRSLTTHFITLVGISPNSVGRRRVQTGKRKMSCHRVFFQHRSVKFHRRRRYPNVLVCHGSSVHTWNKSIIIQKHSSISYIYDTTRSHCCEQFTLPNFISKWFSTASKPTIAVNPVRRNMVINNNKIIIIPKFEKKFTHSNLLN